MAVMASLLKTYEEVKAEIDADRVQGILSSASWLASVMEASAEKAGPKGVTPTAGLRLEPVTAMSISTARSSTPPS